MKNIGIKTSLFIAAGFFAGLSQGPAFAGSRAQRSSDAVEDSKDEKLSPDTLGNIIDALSSQKLVATTGNKFSSPTLNLSNLGAASLSGSVTADGIPGPHGERTMPIDDVVARAYNSAQMIELVLEERKTYALGPRVLYMENGIRSVLKTSGNRDDEEALRETLNRGLDIMSLVLPITGASPQASAQWAANFYRSVLVLAAGLQNNDKQRILKISKEDEGSQELEGNPERLVSALTSAKYGQIYANLLYKYSTTPGTRASKAVLLMRLLGYLGHDLNKDLARRNVGVAQTIADIYRLESDPIYVSILNSIRRGYSPSSQALATLRSRTFGILIKLPERLGKAPNFGE